MKFVLWYLILVNAAAAAVTIYDKHRARARQWRVSEARLLLLSLLGGSPAMYLTMRLIRHKTRRKKFMIGIPAILALQLILFCLIRRLPG